MDIRQLNADRLEGAAVERAEDHKPGWSSGLVSFPLDNDMAVIAGGSNVLGRWKNYGLAADVQRRIFIQAEIVDDQRVPGSVRSALMEDNALERFRMKRIDRICMQLCQRDANLNPASCGNIA